MDKHMQKDWKREEENAHGGAADMNDKLVANLRDINHTMRFLYEGRGSQTRILIVLMEKGTITQQRLTEQLGIQPGSASEVLAKLEKSGLVTRTPSETDRRTTDVSLTEEGKHAAFEAAAGKHLRHAEMLASLSEEEKAELLFLLEKINADWAERYRAAKKEHCHNHQGGHRHHCHNRMHQEMKR